MGLYNTLKALSPQTRLTIGLGFVAWGSIGLYVSEGAEKRGIFQASEAEKARLENAIPKINVVERRREEEEEEEEKVLKR